MSSNDLFCKPTVQELIQFSSKKKMTKTVNIHITEAGISGFGHFCLKMTLNEY